MRERIEEGKKQSSQVAMLDSRVSTMLTNLRAELEQTESSIGKAFHSLDLDRDGVVSHQELLNAMEELHFSKRPDAAAFQELLDDIDIDQDVRATARPAAHAAFAAWVVPCCVPSRARGLRGKHCRPLTVSGAARWWRAGQDLGGGLSTAHPRDAASQHRR